MNKRLLFLIFTLAFSCGLLAQKKMIGEDHLDGLNLIPYPQHVVLKDTGILKLHDLKSICYDCKGMTMHLLEFANQLKNASGIDLNLVNIPKSDGKNIWLHFNAQHPQEGYALRVENDGIHIDASHNAGFFYALQTLKQMLPRSFFNGIKDENANWSLPFVEIIDKPALSHRGFMLDVARHFFNKEEVKRIIDMMSLYKMNIFHWHLTDDQGWRIEIPEYPQLTSIGSIRKASFTNPGINGQKFFDDTAYGHHLWYTQEDIQEVVDYALDRNIQIIPEIDFPGHMVAAITAYPELSCNPSKQYEVRVDAGISKDVLNIGNDKVIDFLKCIMDNLAHLFPYRYIHFGGDECPTDQWKTNKDCLQRIQDNKLNGVEELQSWLIEELGTYVKEKHNKDIMVWDELVAHWNPRNKIKPVVMCWHSNNDAAANKGLKSITCPHEYTYFDMMQISEKDALIDEPYRGGWNDGKVISVERTYSLNPNYKTKGREDFVLGVQANMWTETTNDSEELEYQIFPRLIAVAETGWLNHEKKDWRSFHQRLQNHSDILNAKNINYAQHYFLTKEPSEQERVALEAQSILSKSRPNEVGHPNQKIYNYLRKTASKQPEKLIDAISNFKEAAITQPQPGIFYRINSASSYYKMQFAGSSLYSKDKGVRIHYTPQYEPEELWEFIEAPSGFYLKNVISQQMITFSDLGKNVTLTKQGTPLKLQKVAQESPRDSYIPGVVSISEVNSDAKSLKHLEADLSGNVKTGKEVRLHYPGTWTITKISDYETLIVGLETKCYRWLNQPKVRENSQACNFLEKELLPIIRAAKNGRRSEKKYKNLLKEYRKFIQML